MGLNINVIQRVLIHWMRLFSCGGRRGGVPLAIQETGSVIELTVGLDGEGVTDADGEGVAGADRGR